MPGAHKWPSVVMLMVLMLLQLPGSIGSKVAQFWFNIHPLKTTFEPWGHKVLYFIVNCCYIYTYFSPLFHRWHSLPCLPSAVISLLSCTWYPRSLTVVWLLPVIHRVQMVILSSQAMGRLRSCRPLVLRSGTCWDFMRGNYEGSLKNLAPHTHIQKKKDWEMHVLFS